MKWNPKVWTACYLACVLCVLGIAAAFVVKTDPMFHYHKPRTDTYFYRLNNERSQNDGIIKHFDYDALISGTSMTENFKTTEMDRLFGVNSIKVPFSGGPYREINQNVLTALEYNPGLRIVLRSLDMSYFFDDKDHMRDDLGSYPTYLYDKNILNDVEYLFNRDVLFSRVYPMVTENNESDFVPGITSFDQYVDWTKKFHYGIRTVCPKGIATPPKASPVHMTGAERETVLGNIRQNITATAEAYPQVTFYYFITPYSAVYWHELAENGKIYRQTEAEQIVIEELLKYPNIKLFSFNNRTDITTNINHYKDKTHYGSWINSLILKWMHEGKYQLTTDNYRSYLAQELAFYLDYDYGQLAKQTDYESDYYAAALVNEELTGTSPLHYTEEMLRQGELHSAEVVTNQYQGSAGIRCRGSIQRDYQGDITVPDYLIENEYIGNKIVVEDISKYRYLVFYGKKLKNHGQPTVYLYDENHTAAAEYRANYRDLNDQWHQYVIDVSELSGTITVIFHGGYVDYTGSQESEYIFSNIGLY